MAMKTVSTEDAPMAVGPYSQATVAGNLVFVSGQIPVDPETGKIGSTIEEQTRQVLNNLLAIIDASGVKRDGIASTTVYLTDIGDFPQMNVIYSEMMETPYPARACVAVSALPKGVKIMVSAIGVLQ